MELCPCGSETAYAECCEPVITGAIKAPSAERLMRARYSAYAKTAVEFILTSTIDEKREECDEKTIRTWSEHSTWHKLEIISTENGGPDDTEGMVEFIVHFSENGAEKTYHEKGLFRKVNDDWRYVDGEIQKPKPFVRTERKVSRNDPCPCGSGKKYKKCCGK
jgi:SEC-C motif domain protein